MGNGNNRLILGTGSIIVGDVTEIGTGILTLSGDASGFTGNTLVSGGTLVIGSSAMGLSGNVTNNGVLDVQSSRLAVGGAVAGNGTIGLAVDTSAHGYLVNSAAGSDLSQMHVRIDDGSTVRLNQTLVLAQGYAGTVPVGLTADGYYHLFRVVQATGGGTDSQGVAYNTGSLLLTDVGATGGTATTSTNNAAMVVQTYNGSNAALGQLGFAVTSLTSQADIDKAGAQLRPETSSASQAAAFGSVGQALQTITLRNDTIRTSQSGETGMSAGDALEEAGVWAQSFGSTTSQGVFRGIDGYRSNTAGFALGGDTKVLDAARAGVALAYARTYVGDKGTRSGSGERVDSYIASLYSTYTGSPWYVDTSVTAGWHDYDSTRLVSVTNAPTEVAKGRFSAFQYGAKAEFGYPVPVGRLVVTPLASLTYNHLAQNNYTETNAPASALHVDGVDADSLRSSLGSKVDTTFVMDNGWAIQPTARAAWVHEFSDKAPAQTSQFVAAGGGAFTTPGQRQVADGLGLGASVNLVGGGGFSVSLKYDTEMKRKNISQTGSLEARLSF
jgi:outer membrane autotransporter protein